MFQYGKPAAIYTNGGALFGGLFKAWCGYRSIEHRIRPWPENLRFDEEWQKVLTPENRQRTHKWPRALLQHFWMQRRNHNWRCGRGSMPGVHMQQEAFSGSFWLFWIWWPDLLCKQQRTLGRGNHLTSQSRLTCQVRWLIEWKTPKQNARQPSRS